MKLTNSENYQLASQIPWVHSHSECYAPLYLSLKGEKSGSYHMLHLKGVCPGLLIPFGRLYCQHFLLATQMAEDMGAVRAPWPEALHAWVWYPPLDLVSSHQLTLVEHFRWEGTDGLMLENETQTK